MLNKILQFILKFVSKLILEKYQPIIIGITGSIGKTSAKEAIYLLLKDQQNVRMSSKNYNNELGLPLTIIGEISAGHDLLAWLLLFFRTVKLILIKDKNYPRVLILEMGADRPGDIAYLTAIAPPAVGVVTGVSYSHLEYFGSLLGIKKEKQVLIENITSQHNRGLAVLNYDNDSTRDMATVSKARVLTYGLQAGADLRAQDVVFNFAKGNYELSGLNFKLNYNGSVVPVFMPQVMTESAIYAALAAAAVGIYFDLNLVEIARVLNDFSLPPGRMNVLPGIKHSFIIDDTYNSSPAAALAALDILGRIKVDESAAKYAILGDMLELGTYTEEGHRLVGAKIVASGISRLIAVGEKSKDIIFGATTAGLADDYIWHFDRSEAVGQFLSTRLKAGDVVLVKGSQGMRMEKVVKDIMAEPSRAAELLVRQGSEWTK
ncbi:MAG: Mur ligase family protein [Patescibacteria group bacterium]|jgi:UDP-N-acetylmuramoyl-tripeptide--D-alanyl-D-alanine ligase